ncbi:MAG: hypothetical protein EZS28_045587 [Streblomastix strix]|uniref:Uncharacterized protein n=1 Tax=Streblomastix strix TaxID=222440 RepID=A0A5J4TKY5_9EUKA|nr:MAG: hypothetical protein EZS28_045587 [Streblomastix strix]
MQVLKEIFWWKSMVTRNKPIQATIALAQTAVATVENLTHWGATLKLQDPAQEIETDNSTDAFNINRASAAVALAKLVDRTPEKAEVLNLQLHTFHNPGVTNRILDSLSRLATQGDY